VAGDAILPREDTRVKPAGDGCVAVLAKSPEIRERAAALLRQEGLPLARASAGPEDFLESCRDLRPDLVVIELDSTRQGPVRAIRRLREELPGARILAIARPRREHDVRRALGAGADGVVLAPELDGTLPAAARSVLAGQVCLPRALRHLGERPALTHREKQALGMVAAGATNRQIADALFLTESTVKGHLASAFRKLGVRSRAEAVAVVSDLGLFRPAREGSIVALHGLREAG
jgi:DNA-binding NarL/FixJ family response regulator